jgi:murein DD-endopeptidase MepM/ murein hydrolase activator NlpD
MYFKFLYKILIAITCIFIFVPAFFIPTFSSNFNQLSNSPTTTNINNKNENYYKFEINSKGFVWPTPGYTRINSYFGRRSSPTRGASSFHLGIDIGAPAGSNLVAVTDSRVISLGFNGSGGYSIILKSHNLQFVYHHVNPNYIIKVNDIVKAGQVIGKVGPKNVYGVKNNPYRDSNGNPTNGATTRSSFTFNDKKRRCGC